MTMHGYIAFYRGEQIEIYAESKLAAQLKAAKHFKARKSYNVDVCLCERPDGSPVFQSTCN